MIIQGDKITCAGSVFPTSSNPNISKRLGTRHRAALGISDLHYNLSLDDARMLLLEELQPKKETFYEADTIESEGDEDEKDA